MTQPTRRSTAEVVASAVINGLCILVIAGGWMSDKVDSTVAIGALLALSGVDLVGKLRGKTVPPGVNVAILALAFGAASPLPAPPITAEVPDHETVASLPVVPLVLPVLRHGFATASGAR